VDATIILVDDEPKVIEFMKPFLELEGFTVFSAQTGPQALQLVRDVNPDLVVLDWMLPGMSGLDICRELRKTSHVGIIMVTARSEEADRIVGLEVGADDYLVKPFSLRELAARIRSVLRRLSVQTSETTDGESAVLHRGELTIDEARFRVWKRGQEVVLTPTEFQMLLILATKPGVVYSRLQLLQSAMGEAYLNYERTIDSHISHLRKKIEGDPANPIYVQTVYGIGYRFGDQT